MDRHPRVAITAPIVLALAFAWGLGRVLGLPPWPPGAGDVTYWLFWLNATTLLFVILRHCLPAPRWLFPLLGLLLLRLSARALVSPSLRLDDPSSLQSTWEAQTWIEWASALAFVWLLIVYALARTLPRPACAIVLLLLTASAALIHVLTGNIKPAMVCIELSGLCLALLLATRISRRSTWPSGWELIIAVPLLACFAIEHFYSNTEPSPSIVTLWLAGPFVGAACTLGFAKRWPTRRRQVVQLILIALSLAAAVTQSYRQYTHANMEKQAHAAEMGEY